MISKRYAMTSLMRGSLRTKKDIVIPKDGNADPKEWRQDRSGRRRGDRDRQPLKKKIRGSSACPGKGSTFRSQQCREGAASAFERSSRPSSKTWPSIKKKRPSRTLTNTQFQMAELSANLPTAHRGRVASSTLQVRGEEGRAADDSFLLTAGPA